MTESTRPAWNRAAALAWPVATQQGLVLAVNLTDRWLAGNAGTPSAIDTVALQAAQTTCFYLSWMVGALGVVATAGASALVARLVGAGDRRGANAAFHQAIVLAAMAGMAGTAVGWAVLPQLLRGLQLDGTAGELATPYLRVTFLFLPMQLVASTAFASLAAAGDTRTPLAINAAAAIVNLPLAWIGFRGLATWPGLGFPGIALGTGMSHALAMVAALSMLAVGRAGLRLVPVLLMPDRRLIARLLRISWPAAMESFSMVAGQMCFLAAVNGLGDASRAAHGIALGWEAVAETFGIAFGVAANVLVGQSLGAKRAAEARRCGLAAYAIGAVAMSLVGAGFFFAADLLLRFFCPLPEQAPIVAAGVPLLQMVAFSMPALASCHILGAALRGAGDTRFPLLFTLIGFFLVRLPLTAWLAWPAATVPLAAIAIPGWGLGLSGCWLAMQADLWFRGGLFLARFLAGRWQQTRV